MEEYTYEKIFESLKKDWDGIEQRTLREIKNLLKIQEDYTTAITEGCSLMICGNLDYFEVNVIEVYLDKDDNIILLDDDNDTYNAEELAMGQALWLYYNMF